MGKRECGGGVGSGSERASERSVSRAAAVGAAAGGERERERARVGRGARGRRRQRRRRERDGARPARFRPWARSGDATVRVASGRESPSTAPSLESRSRLAGPGGAGAGGRGPAGPEARPSAAGPRSIVARRATPSDKEIGEEWRRARSGRAGGDSRRRGRVRRVASSASERARGERAETMAPGHGGVRIVRAPPRARAGRNFGSARKKKISLWFDGAGRGRHSQREVSFFASPA